MIMAVVKNNMVQNVIVINQAEVESMAKALDAELIDASQYGLAIGDLKTDKGWTRNRNGEQYILKPQNVEEFVNYRAAMNRVSQLEFEVEISSLKTYNEMTSILTGEVEKDELLA